MCLTIFAGSVMSIFPYKVGMVLDTINNATIDNSEEAKN